MKWVVVATTLAFLLLVCLRLVRSLARGQATIHIAHMKSDAEAADVATILQGLHGVLQVNVDLERHFAQITYRKGKVTVEELLQALHAGGF
jgi:copper chaperone CopZ